MFPIVLAHGIARFDVLGQIIRERLNLPDTEFGDRRFQYFKGIKTHLEPEFAPVFHPNQDFAGPVTLRAAQLKARIDEIISDGAEKVHIIAHSMGGLDARHMIVDLDMADRVASLTTIGTPHLGTVLADHLINRGGNFLIDILEKVVNLDLQGFNDLTIAACEQFSLRAEDREATNQVFYQTYASSEDFKQMFAPLIPSWLFIRENEGRNDGLVPFKSQQWKPELVGADGTRKTIVQKEFPFPADHLNQVGWWDLEETIFFGENLLKQKQNYENKIKAVYLEIVRDLQQTFN